MGRALEVQSPSVCAVEGAEMHGRGLFECRTCVDGKGADGREPAGCPLRRQGPDLYGWSESNVQYERIGTAKR